MMNQLTKICKTLKETKGINICFSNTQTVEKLFKKVCENLEEGGRGVGNVIEEFFITPLSTYIFDKDIKTNQTVTIRDIKGLGETAESAVPVVPEIIAS